MSGFFEAITAPKRWLVDKVVTGALKRAADGGYGPKAKAAYWWTYAHAATWGAIAGVADFGFREFYARGLCDWCMRADATLLSVCLLLTTSGLMVGFHAAQAPAAGSKP